MARAARTHPEMNTRFRFRFRTAGKRVSVSRWTPNPAASMPTSTLLTREPTALCWPPQTEGTLGNKVPRALGHGLSLPTRRNPVHGGVEASTRAPGVRVPGSAHHHLTADVHLRGDENASQNCAPQTVPAPSLMCPKLSTMSESNLFLIHKCGQSGRLCCKSYKIVKTIHQFKVRRPFHC